MRIELKFRNTDARTIEYYLQRRYKSKANLEKLAMVAIRREVADEAKKEYLFKIQMSVVKERNKE